MPGPFDPRESPLPSFMTPMVQQTNVSDALARASSPTAVQSAPTNPFDQFDAEPAMESKAAQGARIAPTGQPSIVPATASASKTQAVEVRPSGIPWGTADLSPEAKAATQKFNADIRQMVNSGASRAAIMARVEQERKVDPNAAVTGLDEALAWRAAHPGGIIPVGIQAPDQPRPEPSEAHGTDKGVLDAIGGSVGNGVFMSGLDELGGVIGATENSFLQMFGSHLDGGAGEGWRESYDRISEGNRQALADAEHYHPGTYLAGTLAGNLLTAPLTMAKGTIGAGRVIAEGAALGGANGFLAADGGLLNRVENAAKGAAIGGALSTAVGVPLNALATRVLTNRVAGTEGQRVIAAADRLSAKQAGVPIQPMVGHVNGGGLLSQAQAILEPTIFGGRLGGLTKRQALFDYSAGSASRRIANDAAGGTARELADIADIVNNPNVPGSLGAFESESKAVADKLYGRAEALAGPVKVPTPAAVQRIDAILKEWDAVPGGVKGADKLRALRAKLVSGPAASAPPAPTTGMAALRHNLTPQGMMNAVNAERGTFQKPASAGWTIDGLRRLRTAFGDGIDSGERELKEAAKRIWGPLSDDIFKGLRVANRPEAAKAYKVADRQWANRVESMAAIRKVIGKDADLSADAVAGRLASMSRRDYGYLARAMRDIDPDQAGMIRGSLIAELGKPVASRAVNVEPGRIGFSLESFATRWTSMSDPAKRAMFAPETVRDLNDLAMLARANRAVNQLGNPSRSGILIENSRQLRTLADEAARGAGGGVNRSDVQAGLGVAAAGHLTGSIWGPIIATVAASRLLASPGVARAIVRGMKSGKVEAVARGLSMAARNTPAAAQQILQLRDQITQQSHPVGVIDPDLGLPHTESVGPMPIAPVPLEASNPFDQFDR